MRIIVYGIGAIGGVLAASLALEGREVIGIARGRMLEAIRAANGLTLISHRGREIVAVPCVESPDEIAWRPDDIVLLTMKSNDTDQALTALRASGVYAQTIACLQNGVANERLAQRIFPNVFSVVVMMPTQYVEPGIVVSNAAPMFGVLDVGRYPTGIDEMTNNLCDALNTKNIQSATSANVMDGKYGKLLLNVGNAVTAALGPEARHGPWYERARSEAEAAYKAAGISYYTVDFGDPRRELLKQVTHEGIEPAGSSSAQSLLRGTGSIETDFLSGEIVLLGRLHGVDTPVNAALMRATDKMARDGIASGTFPESELEQLVNAS